jgi:hypothetical protein
MRRASSLIVAAVAVGATVAYATIPDAGGTIHACYDIRKGTLRVVDTDAGQTCGSTERALVWSQTGPQGPMGPAGPSDSVVTHVPDFRLTPTTNTQPVFALDDGDWVISGKVVARNQGNRAEVICRLLYPAAIEGYAVLDTASADLYGYDLPKVATLAFNGGLHVSGSTNVQLTCGPVTVPGDEFPPIIDITHAAFTATRVGTFRDGP